MDNDLALKIYIKARATPKVVAAFAERREFDKILIYSKQVICMCIVDKCFSICFFSSLTLSHIGKQIFFVNKIYILYFRHFIRL